MLFVRSNCVDRWLQRPERCVEEARLLVGGSRLSSFQLHRQTPRSPRESHDGRFERLRPTRTFQHARGGGTRGLVVAATDRKTPKTDRASESFQRRLLLGRQTIGLGNIMGEAQGRS